MLLYTCTVEGQDAAAAAAKSDDAGHKPTTDTKKNKQAALDKSFLTQALAIVRAKKWQVYQGHVSTQVALGGSNFVYFFWYVRLHLFAALGSVVGCCSFTLVAL